MREEACPSVDAAAADRRQAQGANAMEKLLARRKFVDIGRRGAPIVLVDVTGIVYPAAEPRMGLQPCSVGQVNGMRRDVVHRGSPLIGRGGGCGGPPHVAERAVLRRCIGEDWPEWLLRAEKLF